VQTVLTALQYKNTLRKEPTIPIISIPKIFFNELVSKKILIESETIQMMAINIILLPRFFVSFNEIRPNSIALLPPDICAPRNIKDLSPTLKYSLFTSSVPDLTSK
jgi:hypothetical protein